MPPRRTARRRPTQLAFEALAVEGALISADWLSKVAQLQVARQTDADYQIPKGLNLRDEVGRYWRMAQAQWSDFVAARATSAKANAASERFVVPLLRDIFGFTTLEPAAQVEIGGRLYPIGHHAVNGHVPAVIAGADESLDAPASRFGDGGRRRSAFGLAQEYLNAKDGALWGITTNGVMLRVLRDNASLTCPAWIEADLARIFTEERYADFAALWLLIHETRFGKPDAPATDCPLELWRADGREEGTRARDHLRRGVEEALELLGQGFLTHPDNNVLRQALQDGTLTTNGYFQQLLRLVYRLIFLLTVEERGLLHPDGASEPARRLYAEGYSLRRLRERAAKRNAHDRYGDLWEALKIVLKGVARGEPRLALPALGGLFAEDQCPALDVARLENRALAGAVFRLAWLREDSGLSRVNWRDMGPEELGSVYESLLDLSPVVAQGARVFRLGNGESKGAARKMSGSYYTHDDLVQLLLDQALEPLVATRIAAAPAAPTNALLQISVVDPACGSGHFLLSAARRLAVHLARLQANGTPSASEYRAALRQTISHCIYGVDRNPMAVELCKAALWIETVVPGRPLSFLDAHIRCGDALLGILDLKLLGGGIPGEAYEVRDGDEKAAAAALRQANKQRVEGTSALPLMAAAAASAREVEALPEDTVEQVEAKRAALLVAEADAAMKSARLRADLFCSAFFARKIPATQASVPVTADIDRIAAGQPPRPSAMAITRTLAAEHHFFHWPLMFPDVFARGGFDLVLGNPPWETMSPDAKEWFAPYDPAVRELAPEPQKQRIAEILALPGMQEAWDAHCRTLYDAAAFMKESGRFKLFAEGNLGKGDFNVYRMFVETAFTAVRQGGTVAQFVPENFYNGSNAAAIRARLFDNFKLRLLVAFDNARKIWFSGIHAQTKFCMYVADRGGSTSTFSVVFGVNKHAKLASIRNGTALTYPVSQIREFSPDALSIVETAHPNDITIVQKLYARFPKFGADRSDLSQRKYLREMDLGNSGRFSSNPPGLPLYQGDMVSDFDYRAATYLHGHGKSAVWRVAPFGSNDKKIMPQWYLERSAVPEKAKSRVDQFRLGFGRGANPSNQRSLAAAIIPPAVICGDKVPTLIFDPSDARLMMFWLAVTNSIVMDFLARKKIAKELSFSVMDSLPLPRAYRDNPLERAIAARALRLTAAGPEMRSFWHANAPQLGLDEERDSPCEDPAERDELRSELDVLVARDVFGLTRDEMRYLLDPADILGADCGFETFGALQRAEKKAYGEFRTRRLILEAWDGLDKRGGLHKSVATGQ